MRLMSTLMIALCIAPPLAGRAETFPPNGWKESPNPIASPLAIPGGMITVFGGQYPNSLNYYLDNNTFTSQVFGAMYDALLTLDPLTLDYQPGLASKWSISDDKLTYTFTLNPDARWSDGKPITAHDVAWTFQAILNPKNLTGSHKVSLERFHPPIVKDDHTIVFTARSLHWSNLGTVGGFNILPAHAFKDLNFNEINFNFPVISGPYRLGTITEGISILMERRKDNWNRNAPSMQHTGNFQTIRYKFFADRINAFEAFKKGEIDIYPVYTSRLWVNQTSGPRFQNNYIVKQKVINRQPVGFQGFAMNMRKFPFDDIRVRKAMAHLLDRKKMNQTLMYGQYFLHRSYMEDLYNADTPCTNPVFDFNKEKARKLLADAGFKVNPKTGILEKNGRALAFDFLARDSTADKFLAIFSEDLKDVGIRLRIVQKDWAAWVKDMETFNYQMTWAAWSSGVFKDPEGMWASSEADRQNGNNITGFKHPAVDALIEKQKGIFDVAARNAINRKIDRIVSDAVPYVLLWNINATRLLYWNKFGTPDTVLSKYGREESAFWYWWFDPDAEMDLRDAMAENAPLPPLPSTIRFDEQFKPLNR